MENSLSKLIRLCSSISDDASLLAELQQEVEQGEKKSPITSMLTGQLKSTNVQNLGINSEILSIFFYPDTITEIDLFSSEILGIKCFFMSEGTIFPIHDHPNRVVVTGILHGKIKYMNLDKTPDPNIMNLSTKGTGIQGTVLFNTSNYQNAHTILALQNTIIIDIFMHGIEEMGNYYKVTKKIGKKFFVSIDQHVFFLTRSFKTVDCRCQTESKKMNK